MMQQRHGEELKIWKKNERKEIQRSAINISYLSFKKSLNKEKFDERKEIMPEHFLKSQKDVRAY